MHSACKRRWRTAATSFDIGGLLIGVIGLILSGLFLPWRERTSQSEQIAQA